MKSSITFDAEDGYEDFMQLGLYYGKENHHDGSSRLGTYTGWEAGFVYEDDGVDDDVAASGGVFAGANYYIANNLYVGFEARYTLMIMDGRTMVAPGLNGMLTVGFKL